jgi:mono/diheme cytochrome c family protein
MSGLGLGAAAVVFAVLLSPAGVAQEKALKGDVDRGKAIFDANCDECHDAYSREARTGPGLQGLKSGKLPDGRPATHDKLIDVVNNGPAEMPKFEDRLTAQQKEDVVAFLMTL